MLNTVANQTRNELEQAKRFKTAFIEEMPTHCTTLVLKGIN